MIVSLRMRSEISVEATAHEVQVRMVIPWHSVRVPDARMNGEKSDVANVQHDDRHSYRLVMPLPFTGVSGWMLTLTPLW